MILNLYVFIPVKILIQTKNSKQKQQHNDHQRANFDYLEAIKELVLGESHLRKERERERLGQQGPRVLGRKTTETEAYFINNPLFLL